MDPITISIIASIITAILIGLYGLARKLFLYYLSGITFLVVGHSFAGKTSFYNFLRLDEYAESIKAKRTTIISEKMIFDIDKGKERKIHIKSAFDIPGTLTPANQVEEIRKKRPRVLIVFVAVNKPDIFYPWLKEFLINLRAGLEKDKGLADELRSLIVVLNKIDLINKPELYKHESETRKMIDQTLGPVMLDNVKLVDVIPCTLLKEEKRSESATNEIILSVVNAAKRKRGLVVK